MLGLTSDDLRRAADAVEAEACEGEHAGQDWVNDGKPEHGEIHFRAAVDLHWLAGRLRSSAAMMDAEAARAAAAEVGREIVEACACPA